MSTPSLTGKTALVTGASSGLGADFARNLAGRGCNLILVARREELLRAVRQEIVTKYGIDVQVLVADLADRATPQRLYDRIAEMGKTVDVLINNAGYGLYGRFTDLAWEREHEMLELDIVTLTHLTKLFVGGMLVRRFGYILHVASIGAYQPSPLYASYSAAKSYVLNFGEALDYELRGTGVHSTVVSPGITATEFLKVSGQQPTLYQKVSMMQSPRVVDIAVGSMLKGRSSVVPGFFNAVTAWSNRLIPRRLSAAIGYQLMKSK